MATERTPRESETREEEHFRQNDSWNPASILPTPKPQDGWVFRWIRTSILGQSDNTNVSRSMREGWIPVKAEDHPELEIQSDYDSRFQGTVEVGGLLLCKAPEEKIRSRTEHFQRVSANPLESVDNNFMRENDPRMPLSAPERNTRTTFGRS